MSAATRVYVATGATDMRLGSDGLYALVVGKLQQDSKGGHLVLFANSRKDRERGKFPSGERADRRISMSAWSMQKTRA